MGKSVKNKKVSFIIPKKNGACISWQYRAGVRFRYEMLSKPYSQELIVDTHSFWEKSVKSEECEE